MQGSPVPDCTLGFLEDVSIYTDDNYLTSI
jgi:hypothetical protein